MRSLSIISILLVVLSIACTNPKQKEVLGIEKLETELYAEQMIDREKGIALINAYVLFAKNYPEDTASAHYLFKAGEIAMNLQIGEQAITYFKAASGATENFSKEPECMFLAAFIYENQLGKLEEAEKLYRLFLKKFPEHALAKDAKASIQYLGKSPEELIKMFQEQNQ